MPYRNKSYDQFINTDLVSTSYEALQYDQGIVGCINLMQTYINGKFAPPIYKDRSFFSGGNDEVWISHTIDRRKSLKDIGRYYDAYRDINNYFCFQSGIDSMSSFMSYNLSEIQDSEYYVRYKIEVPDNNLKYSEVTGWESGTDLYNYMTNSIGYGNGFSEWPNVFNVSWISGGIPVTRTFPGGPEPSDLYEWSSSVGSKFYISSLIKLYEYNKLSNILYSDGDRGHGRGIYGYNSYLNNANGLPALTVDATLQNMAKKIQDLASIKDPDLIDYNYIGTLANYMGIDFETNIDSIITNYAFGEESRNNTLRNFLSHMPEFNKIKGCSEMLEATLLSIGIIAKIIPLYRNLSGSYVRQDLIDGLLNKSSSYLAYKAAAGDINPNEWYPSTHFSIDVSNYGSIAAAGQSGTLDMSNVLKVVSSVVSKFKPTTTVIDSILVSYIDVINME